MDKMDSRILRELQDNFPLTERPYEVIAERLQISEKELWSRTQRLLHDGVIRRIGANLPGNGTTSAGFQSQVSDRSEEILVWLLRRFVSPSFIDRYRSNNDTIDEL